MFFPIPWPHARALEEINIVVTTREPIRCLALALVLLVLKDVVGARTGGKHRSGSYSSGKYVEKKITAHRLQLCHFLVAKGGKKYFIAYTITSLSIHCVFLGTRHSVL